MRRIALIAACLAFAACTGVSTGREPSKSFNVEQSKFTPITLPAQPQPFVEPELKIEAKRPVVAQPAPKKVVEQKQPKQTKQSQEPRSTAGWRTDPEISWYGPGLFGNGMACGGKLTKQTLGVAHKTLPCGTRVTFSYKGREITVPVVDRGPYVSGRIFDLTAATARYLNHQFTGPIKYRIED